jgi:hypothetical protein
VIGSSARVERDQTRVGIRRTGWKEREMEQREGTRDGRVAFGLVLVLIGGAILIARVLGGDIVDAIAEAGWPFFVIIPGVVLLTASVFPAPPQGRGLAIAGAIVTTIGTILLVMDMTGRFDAWAYAWALIPGGAGLGSLLYGLFARDRELTGAGVRLIGISAVLFAIGAWFFETTFATGEAPLDLATWWPVLLVAIGALVMVRGITRSTAGHMNGGVR